MARILNSCKSLSLSIYSRLQVKFFFAQNLAHVDSLFPLKLNLLYENETLTFIPVKLEFFSTLVCMQAMLLFAVVGCKPVCVCSDSGMVWEMGITICYFTSFSFALL